MTSWLDLRQAITKLTGMAERDVRLLIGELSGFADMGVALNDVMPLLVDTYGDMAASVAAEWYDDLRAEQEPGGRYRARPAPIPKATGVPELVAWAASEANSPETMLQLALGGMQRRISDQSRATVIGSAWYDPKADGWMRVGAGDNCDFCDTLISRGAVYSAETVRFGAHDHCNCQAAPSFGQPSDIFDVDAYRRGKQRRENDEIRAQDNARARAWIAENLVEVN